MIVAKDLAAAVAEKTGRVFGPPLVVMPGRLLERLVFQHPLYARDSLGVVGDYVTLDAGTGVVHTAPGHGADDYHTGIKYGLESTVRSIRAVISSIPSSCSRGCRCSKPTRRSKPRWPSAAGCGIARTYDHSYPHCWRCHNPVIFLATSQWFIAMDTHELRSRALNAIDATRWIPSWGRDRIYNMIANRPDWCISRQRTWGVPIPAVDCKRCGQPMLTKALTDRTADVFEQYGADAWYERPIEEFLPDGLTCDACGGREFEREANILDVWFDSGSSHEAVLPRWGGLRWPADLYLEGSDQHRGWFHSSLLVGIGTRGRAPFDQVLTHGFVVDDHGRKMSKSLGNTILPQEVMKQSGADVLRLWVSMVDYREDIRLGKEILARVVEAYRKFRNVIRVLMANLYDFDPVTDAVPASRMVEIDRWAMARYAAVATKIVDAYADYDYPTVYQAANAFVTVDLSAFYVDVTKDRMYTLGARVRGASVGSDGDVPHRGRIVAAAGADSAVHDGRGVAQPAGTARGVGPPRAVPDGARGVDGRRPSRSVGAVERGARSGQRRPRGEAAAEGDHLVAVGEGESRGSRAAGPAARTTIGTSCRRSSASRTSISMCCRRRTAARRTASR